MTYHRSTPRWPVRLNQAKTGGLVFCDPLIDAGQISFDLIQGYGSTYTNDPLPGAVPGLGVEAPDLNGSNERIDWSNTAGVINGLNDLTISAWVNFKAGAADDEGIFGNWHSGNSGHAQLIRADSAGDALKFQCTIGGSSAFVLSSTTVPTTGLHLVTGTRRGDTVEIFIDGVSEGTATGLGTSSMSGGGNLWAGTYFDAASARHVEGHVLDCRVYDRALSDAEIWTLYSPETRWGLYRQEKFLFVPSAAPSGRIMSSLVNHGGLAGPGGLAGNSGGLAA